jgi:23S rRNA (cytidine2498-2'-O)-methyltransferase
VDWLFSDVICYPDRLFKLVEKWLASGLAANFACTIKFQGATDHETARRFAAVPGSRLLHLSHNKHELTWIKLADGN